MQGSDDVTEALKERLIAPSPQVVIKVAGGNAKCILDTGSMMSTIWESFIKQHFDDKLKSCHWLELRAANEFLTLAIWSQMLRPLGVLFPGEVYWWSRTPLVK